MHPMGGGLDVPFVVDRFRVRTLCHSVIPMSTSHLALTSTYASLVQVVSHDCINVLLRVRRPFAVRLAMRRRRGGMLFCSSGIPNLPPPKNHMSKGNRSTRYPHI